MKVPLLAWNENPDSSQIQIPKVKIKSFLPLPAH